MSFPVSASLLDAIVLAIVCREETYGYKITQDVRQVIDVSDSTLYPVLRRLMKHGCLSTRDEAVDGRIRRYYGITAEGQKQLETAKADWQRYRDAIETVLFWEAPS